ncbi:MAG: NAD(P)H-hydrate dehydratase [bacterium]|nr:NAD(P)H-hydrate dehydratase [bacterium]
MEKFEEADLKKLYLPARDSHKGQNGKLTIIGGSHLFHGASLWALKVASRIVDMVFYSSVPENNTLAEQLKGELYDLIAVPRKQVEDYIKESDAVLIGPGLPREGGRVEDEESTKNLTERLLKKFPDKKWIIDAGSLTEMEPEWLKWLNGNAIITPHHKEFEDLFNQELGIRNQESWERIVSEAAKQHNCTILLKGPIDIICSPRDRRVVEGGNEGMTKGGTGDVLAGLAAALACKNDLFLAACAGSFINKKAGDELYKTMGPYFNASDLCDEIPKVMKELIVG